MEIAHVRIAQLGIRPLGNLLNWEFPQLEFAYMGIAQWEFTDLGIAQLEMAHLGMTQLGIRSLENLLYFI
uniref:Uncharacterized protein n=1 Tax=Romanomermis culicivorax TaxID=13658 RepID=A0A915JGT6_ROMCU